MYQRSELEKAIREVIEGENITYAHTFPDRIPTLRINADSNYPNGWHVTLGDAPGNAYCAPVTEAFVTVGLSCEDIDYSENMDIDEIERDDADNDLELAESEKHISANMKYWLDDACDQMEIFMYSVDHSVSIDDARKALDD